VLLDRFLGGNPKHKASSELEKKIQGEVGGQVEEEEISTLKKKVHITVMQGKKQGHSLDMTSEATAQLSFEKKTSKDPPASKRLGMDMHQGWNKHDLQVQKREKREKEEEKKMCNHGTGKKDDHSLGHSKC